MCIVCVFPAGVDKTTDAVKKAIENGLSSNNESAGFALRRKDEKEIYIKKGYVKNVNAIYKDIMDMNPGIDDVLLVHGRIATHGGNTKELAHPFVCSDDYNELVTLEGKVDKPILMHNGVFKISSYKESSGLHSDTSDFAFRVASSKLFQTALFKNPKKIEKMLDTPPYNILGWSKVVFLYPIANSEPVYIGTGWRTVEGLGKFSNEGYSRTVYDYGGSSTNPKTASHQNGKDGQSCNLRGVYKPLVGPQTDLNRGGEDSDNIFFRYDHDGICPIFSNTDFRVNIYNYPFVHLRIDKVLYNKCIANNVYRKAAGISVEDLKILNKLYQFVNYKVISLEQEVSYIRFESVNNALNVDRIVLPNMEKEIITEIPNDLLDTFVVEPKWGKLNRVDQKTGEIITSTVSSHTLSEFLNSYNSLRRHSLFDSSGFISLSYSKKLFKIVEDHINCNKDKDFIHTFNSKSFSTRKEIIEKNKYSSIFMLEDVLIKRITANSNTLLHDVSPLALALFLLERSNHLSAFEESMIKEAVATFAFKYQLIRSDFMFYISSDKARSTKFLKPVPNSKNLEVPLLLN